MLESFFREKSILVTGGTGSIGSLIVKRLVDSSAGRVVVLSRDETKQHDLMRSDDRFAKKVKCIIGDVRDGQRVYEAMDDIDIVIHTAAMKHVPACEDNVFEAIETNLLGSENVKAACILHDQVSCIVVVSTDKAAIPHGTMGMTKALQERLFLQSNMMGIRTVATRFGNVLGSRGSVVWTFLDQLAAGTPLKITDPNMRRYIMTPKQAVDLVLFAASEGPTGSIVLRKMSSCTVQNLATALSKDGVFKQVITGVRPGEKMEETIFNIDELPFLHELQIGDDMFYLVNKSLKKLPEKEINRIVSEASVHSVEVSIDKIRELLIEAKVLKGE